MTIRPETTPITERHAELLAARGIDEETITRLGWQSLKNPKDGGDWLVIPYTRKGQVVGRKYRRITKAEGKINFYQDKGSEQCLYNLEALEDFARMPKESLLSQQLVITEGEMDCAIALQCGYLAVSVPNGAPDKPIDAEDTTKFDYLKDVPDWVTIILAVDGDSAGQILRQELALRLGWHRCKWVKYPKDCKDLNDVFIKYRAKGVEKTLTEHAQYLNTPGLFKMSELPPLPDLTAYSCGVQNLEDNIKLRPGDLIVVTGIPSHGKTTFVNEIACNMAHVYGWNVCFGSFEQSPRGDHQRYLRTYFLGKPQTTDSGWPNWSEAEIATADAWIDQRFSFIVPEITPHGAEVRNDEMATVNWVINRCEVAIHQHRAQLLVIDPWNEMEHDRPRGMNQTEYTGWAIKEFKRLARRHMVTVIIVAHPAKLEKNKDGEYSVPTLYDIADSAHWYNKPEIGIVIHQEVGKNSTRYTLVRVAKVRYWGVIGKPCDKHFEYNAHTGRFIGSMFEAADRPRKGRKEVKNDSENAASPQLPYADN